MRNCPIVVVLNRSSYSLWLLVSSIFGAFQPMVTLLMSLVSKSLPNGFDVAGDYESWTNAAREIGMTFGSVVCV